MTKRIAEKDRGWGDILATDLIVGYLKSLDEHTKKREVIAVLSPRQAELLKKRIEEQRKAHLFPIIHPYFRTNKKSGKVYMLRSRRH